VSRFFKLGDVLMKTAILVLFVVACGLPTAPEFDVRRSAPQAICGVDEQEKNIFSVDSLGTVVSDTTWCEPEGAGMRFDSILGGYFI